MITNLCETIEILCLRDFSVCPRAYTHGLEEGDVGLRYRFAVTSARFMGEGTPRSVSKSWIVGKTYNVISSVGNLVVQRPVYWRMFSKGKFPPGHGRRLHRTLELRGNERTYEMRDEVRASEAIIG